MGKAEKVWGDLIGTGGKSLDDIGRKDVNECKRNKQWLLYARSKKGKP